jgi:hypothetical protein
MTDYKAIIERDGCETGCGHSKICMCALAEDMADEIERLRVALHQIAGKVSQSDKPFDGDMASEIARAALGEGKE